MNHEIEANSYIVLLIHFIKIGFNLSMPEKIIKEEGSLELYNIKRYFKPLSLN